MRDNGRAGAYTPGVPRSTSETVPAAAQRPATRSRRRRLPAPAEQARRVAWGREWGAVMSEHAKTYRTKG